jgi:hypothetical protein
VTQDELGLYHVGRRPRDLLPLEVRIIHVLVTSQRVGQAEP